MNIFKIDSSQTAANRVLEYVGQRVAKLQPIWDPVWNMLGRRRPTVDSLAGRQENGTSYGQAHTSGNEYLYSNESLGNNI